MRMKMVDHPITFVCNCNCVSCIHTMEYSEEGRTFARKGTPFVPYSQLTGFLDDISDEDVGTFNLCGGEPTIDPNFFRFLSEFKRKRPDLLLHIVTNGRMFAYGSFVRKVKEIAVPNMRFDVTFYGSTAGVHDAVTQTPGSFSQTLRGVKNLLVEGIQTEIRIIVQKSNVNDLVSFTQMVLREIPTVFRTSMVSMKYTGNAAHNRENLRVSLTESIPFVLAAADVLLGAGLSVKLLHYPLCTLPRRYWSYGEGVTKNEELVFSKKCTSCGVRDRCPKIWATYLGLFGDEEFIPIAEVEHDG